MSRIGDEPWFSHLPVAGDTPLALNPAFDPDHAAQQFAAKGFTQLRDVLAEATTQRLFRCLTHETPWGIAWFEGGAKTMNAERLRSLSPQEGQALMQGIQTRAATPEYQYLYQCYPILDAYLAGQNPGLYLHRWLEFVNSEPMLALVRQVTGLPGLCKADAQATLFARQQFLGLHTDGFKDEAWRVAYVLNMTPDWHENFGGYLQFYDEAGDITGGLMPRFNCLNLLAVPQRHAVSYVPPFAPNARFALTGWFRDA